MDSLQNILKTKKLVAPNEIELIKEYVRQKYSYECKVMIKDDALIVSVSNSSLAATLQLERPKIIRAIGLKEKKLVIRNG